MTQVAFARLVLSCLAYKDLKIPSNPTVNYFSVFSYFFYVCLCSIMCQKKYNININIIKLNLKALIIHSVSIKLPAG